MIVLFLLLCIADGVVSQIRYSVPEEAGHGTFVGNIAEDLGLDMTKIASRRFQVVPSSRTPYLEVNMENGILFINEKIDREQICKQSASCLLHLEVFLENPLELFRVEIEVVDINDNPPSFPETDITVEISESAVPGTRFPLESAFDPDVGSNALRTYDITTNNYFYLDVQTQTDGNKFAELVLEKSLDREQQASHRYVLTAVDGGQPPRTGTALLVVKVLDSNDNVPVFDQPVYSVSLQENTPAGTLVIQLNATDLDEGQNGEIVYSFSNHISSRVKDLFAIDARTGRIEVRSEVDFEESSLYQIFVQAKDLGPNAVAAHCKVLVKIMDVNDNAPDITFSTVTESVSERAAPGTVIALLSVTDKDAEENGKIHVEILGDVPFKLKPSFRNYFTIVTDGPLNRENADSYSVTVVARDTGTPSLATSKSIKVQVSDENDNAPTFTQPIYDVYVTENNVPGAYIHAVTALDPDVGQNALISYSIMECDIQGMSVKTYVSINEETGYLYALRSFDYEQLKDFTFMVQAKDAGSPELFSNATVKVIIVDQNDNPPSVIAPLGKNGTAREPLPRSAEPGYLVTRIIAMDADDGENARLSYSIQRGNENGMFRMDWRTGELRTARRVSTKRDPNQMYDLLIEVRDHGQPPLSSTASVFVVLVDSVVEDHRERGTAKSKETSLDLTLILIIALGSVSFIFLLAMIVLAVRCQKDKKLNIYTCLTSDCCLGCATCCSRHARARKKKLSKSDIMLVQSANVTGAGTAQVPVEESGSFGSHHQNQNYCYQVCLTPESAKTDLMFLKPCSPSRSTDTEHNPCGAIVTGYTDQQPDIISNGSILSSETKHQRAELSYLVDRPRRVNSSAFQEADLVSSKDSGHGDSEQGDSDHDATNRGHSAGTDLFSNCTEECKALGHSDRCWMPSFVPSDGRQAADYRSNLHVPGMDSVPDTEVFESQEQTGDKSFSTFGKETPLSHHHQNHLHLSHHHATHANQAKLERKAFEALLSSTRAPYKPAYLTRKGVC
ncbi:protocadherin-10-like isoform X1 [Oncorhynchus nerka]|uniref:LOW QUALITY PROTEIN: protocadherin-10-like n=1 Tax=Oncorhynchus gorbuscha TaxID=8017 RepID=UPI000D09F524|nr:protocadherin-10 isoform X1 [Oncorhynchus tshawytscha]XP_029517936.1 LOW QUALITY PROTEIN: protocadherin-10-like [Oncorhynchus nerka]XP_035620866.1 protocadherin-10 isoform X1 [Oncorhynchus keta]XP_046151472.1 LOW QUALITY PROTEIN: protocadherin-10-like [Oncorhynchus gorbuscha]